MHNLFRRMLLAFRIFFRTLFNATIAEQVARIFAGGEPGTTATPAVRPKQSPAAKPPAHREAITLLAALQREARLVDFVQESLAGYSDAQIGDAVRDIHRDCGAVRAAIRPAAGRGEGRGGGGGYSRRFDPNRWRLTGKVTGQPPFRGQLVHPGWEATICEVPTWSGDPAAATSWPRRKSRYDSG